MLIEVEEDKNLDGRHAIEEAMSTFLLHHPTFTPSLLLLAILPIVLPLTAT